jgi:1-aminocyclopropane-1-carboxylate deaminase
MTTPSQLTIPPLFRFDPPRLDTIVCELTRQHNVVLKVLRLDLLHPVVSGNKWYKLRLNLAAADAHGYSRLLSFGGAFSNHLLALSAAAKAANMESIGIVRGELPTPLNPILTLAQAQGMQLHAISRSDYRNRRDPGFLSDLQRVHGPSYLIPEGGGNVLGARGCMEIVDSLQWDGASAADRYLILACGTGTTMAGLLAGIATRSQCLDMHVIGVPVLKGGEFLQRDIRNLLIEGGWRDPGNWHLETAFHGGGYARQTPALQEFIRDFSQETRLPLEPVYTGKLFLALGSLLRSGVIPPGSEIIAIHTGGLPPPQAA